MTKCPANRESQTRDRGQELEPPERITGSFHPGDWRGKPYGLAPLRAGGGRIQGPVQPAWIVVDMDLLSIHAYTDRPSVTPAVNAMIEAFWSRVQVELLKPPKPFAPVRPIGFASGLSVTGAGGSADVQVGTCCRRARAVRLSTTRMAFAHSVAVGAMAPEVTNTEPSTR